MPAYLARRLVQAALILLGVAAIAYLLLYMLPADPARMVAGRTASKDQVELVRQQLGLDLPIWEQFGSYLWKLLQGDLGRSYLQRTQVTELLAARLPASLLLMVGAILCELVIGLTLGAIAGLRRGTSADQALMVGALVFISTPQFVISLSLLYVFAYWLGLVPDRRLWRVQASGPAGPHARPAGRRLVCAGHPLQRHRGAATGLYPDRARQGA